MVDVTFGYDRRRPVLRGIDMTIPRGKVVAIMGGSGCGKTTILRLIGGQLRQQAGTGRCVDGQSVKDLSRDELFALRRRIGMLFQFGALFTDMTVFENVAFPMREHTDLDEPLIRDLVLMKLHAVGLRGAAQLAPSELSGGMARRVALARAVALDPMLVLYDEPFAGLDPISLGVVGQLIRKLNDALGITSVVVTHDVYESLKIVDYLYFVSEGRIISHGTPDEVRHSTDPFVRQFVDGEPDGPVPFHYPARPYAEELPCRLTRIARGVRRVGSGTIRAISRAGFAARFFLAVLYHSPSAFHRLQLTAREIYFAGVLSLVVIMVSGLFVGMVLGLQGYDALNKYGAGDSLGIFVGLSLVRELGPVVAGLLFASRAGSAVTAEIGLMKTTEQLSAMEMMAVDPLARIVAPRFWGGVISMPLLAALFSVMGVFGAYLVGVRLIGVDNGTFWGNMQAGIDFWPDVTNGIIKSVVFGIAVSLIAVFEGYDANPTAEGVSAATTRTVVGGSLAILALDFVLTVFMFRGLGTV